MYLQLTDCSRPSSTASFVVRRCAQRAAYSGTCPIERHAAGFTVSVRAVSLYVPASDEPSWVDTGTNASSASALRIVHGVTTRTAAATSASGGPSARRARPGRPAPTPPPGGTRGVTPVARVGVARAAGAPRPPWPPVPHRDRERHEEDHRVGAREDRQAGERAGGDG